MNGLEPETCIQKKRIMRCEMPMQHCLPESERSLLLLLLDPDSILLLLAGVLKSVSL